MWRAGSEWEIEGGVRGAEEEGGEGNHVGGEGNDVKRTMRSCALRLEMTRMFSLRAFKFPESKLICTIATQMRVVASTSSP